MATRTIVRNRRDKVAVRSDLQPEIGLVYDLDHLGPFRAIQELHGQFSNGSEFPNGPEHLYVKSGYFVLILERFDFYCYASGLF